MTEIDKPQRRGTLSMLLGMHRTIQLAKDLRRPARNALCPCGSGKKSKRCCGGDGVYGGRR